MTEPNTKAMTTRSPEQNLVGMLNKLTPELARALPKHVNPERMARIALTALRTNAKLAQCSPGSFLGSVLSAAQLGLEVNTPLGHAYLIPFKGECTLLIGYQGMMELARRSGTISAIYAYDVREGDDFRYTLGLNPTVHHVPSDDPQRENKPLTHAYAVAKLKDGEPIFTVLSKAQVDKARSRSLSGSSGPWATDYIAMAQKTAIRRLYKWLPKSAEMALAADIDEAPEVDRRQAEAWDPAIGEALSNHGLLPEPQAEEVAEEQQPTAVQAATEELVEKHRAKKAQASVPAREPGEEG